MDVLRIGLIWFICINKVFCTHADADSSYKSLLPDIKGFFRPPPIPPDELLRRYFQQRTVTTTSVPTTPYTHVTPTASTTTTTTVATTTKSQSKANTTTTSTTMITKAATIAKVHAVLVTTTPIPPVTDIKQVFSYTPETAPTGNTITTYKPFPWQPQTEAPRVVEPTSADAYSVIGRLCHQRYQERENIQMCIFVMIVCYSGIWCGGNNVQQTINVVPPSVHRFADIPQLQDHVAKGVTSLPSVNTFKRVAQKPVDIFSPVASRPSHDSKVQNPAIGHETNNGAPPVVHRSKEYTVTPPTLHEINNVLLTPMQELEIVSSPPPHKLAFVTPTPLKQLKFVTPPQSHILAPVQALQGQSFEVVDLPPFHRLTLVTPVPEQELNLVTSPKTSNDMLSQGHIHRHLEPVPFNEQLYHLIFLHLTT